MNKIYSLQQNLYLKQKPISPDKNKNKKQKHSVFEEID